MSPLHKIASAALAQFYTVERKTDEGSQLIVKLKDAAPQWLSAAVYNAHGDMLPDDYKFSMAREACEAIALASADDDMDEAAREFAQNTDTDLSDLLKWLASHTERSGYYCEDAMSENQGGPGSVSQIITAGQEREREEVFQVIRAAIEDEQTEQED
jgi:hypothetical protein